MLQELKVMVRIELPLIVIVKALMFSNFSVLIKDLDPIKPND